VGVTENDVANGQQSLIDVSQERKQPAELQLSGQLAQPTFNLPALIDPELAKEVIAENLDGMDAIRFDKIDMPSGGGIAFTIVDEDGKEEPVKELKGVLLDKYPFRAWYMKSFEEKGDDDLGIPDCFSSDNIHGSGCQAAGIPVDQLCATCPKGQWGSNRKGGRGKDCADKIRIHILPENSVFPKYIDAPPTSLGNFKDYLKRLSNKMNPFYGVVTAISLEKDKNDAGITYSKATFAKAANLTPSERKQMREYINTLLPSMRKITRESIGDQPVDMSGNAGGAGDVIDVLGGAVDGDEQPY
jgi:hypothetical protein